MRSSRTQATTRLEIRIKMRMGKGTEMQLKRSCYRWCQPGEVQELGPW